MKLSIKRTGPHHWTVWVLIADGRGFVACEPTVEAAITVALAKINERRSRLDGLMEVPG